MIEGNFNPEIKKESEEFFVTKSSLSDKLFWVRPDSGEIIRVRNLNSGIVRKIGDEVVSNGRIFKPEGVKGIIKSFQDDTCYMKVEWEDGTESFMKDKDLVEPNKDKKQEKELLIKQGLEVFDASYTTALKQGKKKLAERIASFKEETKDENLNVEDLSYTIKECLRFINKYKGSQENLKP